MQTVHYYRVSTQRQGESGLGLEAQRKAVEDFCLSNNATMLAEFIEVESGKRNNRPQLKAAMEYAALTQATLVVAKVDRLSRNAAFLAQIMESSVPIRFADMPFADRFMVGIMAQVAEWEAEQISKRTKEALQAAKARGVVLGGKFVPTPSQSAVGHQRSIETRVGRADARKLQIMPYIEQAKELGKTTLPALADHLNSLHIKTPRGGKWHPASVKRLLER